MTELKTIVLENLDKMERKANQKHLALENQIQALEVELIKLEEKLLDLSKLYKGLESLTNGLSNIRKTIRIGKAKGKIQIPGF